MDKEKAEKFISAFNEEVKGLEEEFGCTIVLGNIRYSDNGLSTKLNLTENGENGENGEKVTKDATDFMSHAFFYGLKPEDLGAKFINNGDVFKITGCKPKNRKYPILAENVKTGKVYKFTADGVKFGMKMYVERKQKS